MENCLQRTHSIRFYFNPNQFYYDPENCGINILGSGIHHGDLSGLTDNDHAQYARAVDGCPLTFVDQVIKFNYDDEYFSVGEDCKFTFNGSGTLQHHDLIGLGDNDHLQYAIGVEGPPLLYDDQLITFNYDDIDFIVNPSGEFQLRDLHGGISASEPITYEDQVIGIGYNDDYFFVNESGELDIVPLSVMPSGDLYDTMRVGPSGWEATDILNTYNDGAGSTVDRVDGTDERYSNIVYIASGEALIPASTCLIGTVLLVYNP